MANHHSSLVTRQSAIRTTCPYCGVGCQIDLYVKDDRIFRVDAPFDAAPNYGRLCVKGRFGLDFVHHPSRLTAPLIRRVPQTPGARTAATSPDEWREASWDEALDLVAARLLDLRRRYGPDSITANACAKATNEDNYLLQKYLRAVIGTNNIDHCARLCHAGSVAGLQLALGSSAMSNAIAEMPDLECFMVIGSNTAETHPVIATFLKQAVERNGARLIVVDPRQTEMTHFAELWLREKPGTDTALFSAMAHVIVAEKLVDAAFVAARTEGFEEYAASLADKTPEWAAAITGVPAEDIRRAARIYAGAQAAAMYWGMGISQSTHGTDNTLTLTNLALLCGHIGRPGTGLNPLRGQNNVQGCSDMGGVPNFYTAYQPVTDPAVRAAFEAAWGVPLPAEPGLTATEMVDGILSGQVKGWYVMGENPLMSEPNLAHARHAVEHLEFFVAQDIFFNETNVYADVILPAASFAEKDGTFTNSDRRVQRVRQALPPPGQARADWEIVAESGAADDRTMANVRRQTSNVKRQLDLPRPKRHLGRDAGAHARLRRHQLRAAGARGGRPLALSIARSPRHALSVRRRLSARPGQVLAGRVRHGQRAAGCRLPVPPQHRPRALPLARRHDDARLRAGCGVARMHRRDALARCGAVGPGERRLGRCRQPPRDDHRPAARHRPLAQRHDLHPLPLRRGRGQRPDRQPPRSARQNPRLQGVRRARDDGHRRARPSRRGDASDRAWGDQGSGDL